METAADYTRRLRRSGARAHKSMGQVFLTDDEVIAQIIDASTLREDVPLVEIGPGLGVVTRLLVLRVPKLWAVELDRQKAKILEKEFQGQPVEILCQDALRLDLRDLWGERKGYLIGNLPYYITSPLLACFLEQAESLSGMTVMVQKEVADRITAAPGSKAYGVLSVAVQLSAAVTKITDVLPGAFWPVPKVSSAVIRLDLRPYPGFDTDRGAFWRVVKAAFGQRRKTLGNALAAGLALGKEETLKVLRDAGILESRRAETLSIEEFQTLTKSYLLRCLP